MNATFNLSNRRAPRIAVQQKVGGYSVGQESAKRRATANGLRRTRTGGPMARRRVLVVMTQTFLSSHAGVDWISPGGVRTGQRVEAGGHGKEEVSDKAPKPVA
ncbi:hypothetical protein DFP72DRAFT_839541 [Ephemerocybe angulata]|uniref:Uncharacterized protein n=1 Tax=Ephemerocybe angulata TaxID=980116 RepID=A0A8H6IJQ4_9AGAR|nr:hypothetical protein DFP72DRAFT_839541 [Tulosesus angulatus]